MDEAAALADRVGIMDLGRLLALDTPQALMRSLQRETTFELATDRPMDAAVVDALAALHGVERVERLQQPGAGGGPPDQNAPVAEPTGLRLRLYLSGEAALLVAPVAAALGVHGLSLVDVKLGTPTLEDVFIHLTGRTLPLSALAEPAAARGAGRRRAFLAVLHRDLYVTWRELAAFLAQVVLQPLFLLCVLGKVLGSLGYTQHGYANLLFPGLVALTAVITGMQTLAFPLVAEFGWTREIEDRLLAPMPTSFVAAEKVICAVLRALVAALLMIPVGIAILGSIPWCWSGLLLFAAGLLLGALVGARFGLLLGTLVQPQRINLLFSLVFTPLLFTGCSQYPWPSLARLLVPGGHRRQPDDLRQ